MKDMENTQRMPYEDEDRDQNNAFTSQRIPEISTNLQKIG